MSTSQQQSRGHIAFFGATGGSALSALALTIKDGREKSVAREWPDLLN